MEDMLLKDICKSITDCPHSTPVWTDSGKIVIRNFNIKNGRLDLSSPSYTDDKHFNERIRRNKPSSGDLIITREAPMGEVCIIPPKQECCLGQRMVLLKIDPCKTTSEYLLYAIMSRYVQHQIGWSDGTGTTVSNLRIPFLENLKIPIAQVPEQKAIASILSSLDDKIELNNRMNKTLEEIAQTLFKRWFVDFEFPDENGNPYKSSGGKMIESDLGMIPEGWRIISIKECIDDYVGGDWGKDAPTDDSATPVSCIRGADFPAIQSGNISELPMRYIKESSMQRRRLENEDIVLEISGGTKGRPVGRTVFINHALITKLNHPVIYSNFCRLVRCKKPYGLMIYHYIQMKYFSGDIEQYQLQSTGISNFQFNSFLDNFKIILPDEKIAYQFSTIAGSIYAKLQMNDSKILSQIRDTLLPKLMSGEIRVPIAEE